MLLNNANALQFLLCCRTYLPSKVPKVLSLWKEQLGRVSEKAAQSLADPIQYENLFPEYKDSLKAEQFASQQRRSLPPAMLHGKIPVCSQKLIEI